MAAVGIAMLVAMAAIYPWTIPVLIPAVILMWPHERRRIQVEQRQPPPRDDWTRWTECKLDEAETYKVVATTTLKGLKNTARGARRRRSRPSSIKPNYFERSIIRSANYDNCRRRDNKH